MSKQAQDFWTLLKSYPKQIEMPLAQAREADTRARRISPPNPPRSRFRLLPRLTVFGPRLRITQPGRAILYLFGGGFVLGSPATRRKTAGHLAVAAKARVLVAELPARAGAPVSCRARRCGKSLRVAPHSRRGTIENGGRRRFRWRRPCRFDCHYSARSWAPSARGNRGAFALGGPYLQRRQHEHSRGG